MKSWMMSPGPLGQLFLKKPELARAFFDSPTSFTSGKPPGNFDMNRVSAFTSLPGLIKSSMPYNWVLYNPERWEDDYTKTPLIEQQHAVAYMDAFCQVAHKSGRLVILMPARNLVTVMPGDCAKFPSEIVDDAYIRTGLARGGACGDVFVVQAQALQPGPMDYGRFVLRVKNELPQGHALWAGLTTMREDPVARMVECWSAVEDLVDGFYLNTTVETLGAAIEFLSVIHP